MPDRQSASTDFDALGGEPALRSIIDQFVDRLFADMMIGFLFRRADRSRIKEMEYQHAAEHLGAELQYGGRDLRDAHAAHRIMGGQFDRRATILRQVLGEFEVAPEIEARWLSRVEQLRSEITAQVGGQCD